MAASPEVDLSEFLALSSRHKPGSLCSVGQAIAELEGAEAAQLKAALDSPLISAQAVVAWLERRDRSVARSAVGHHRKGTCRCRT